MLFFVNYVELLGLFYLTSVRFFAVCYIDADYLAANCLRGGQFQLGRLARLHAHSLIVSAATC